MDENKELSVVMEKTLTAGDIRKQVNLIQEVMKDVMQEGQHYGKIPGCGDKPTLLKPGAEKLSMTFRLRPIMDNDRDIAIIELSNGHREVRVYCHILNMAGVELATGIGSCSTMESKYRYRGGEKISTGKPVPTEYWNLKKADKIAEAQKLIGGPGLASAKINGNWEICKVGEKMENPDIADTYNTVLKMAKKRAYVDGILSATGSSDIFTQDIEDFVETTVAQPTNGKPAVKQPEEVKKPAPAKSQEQVAAEETFNAEEVPGKELNVLEALKQPKDAEFDMWGILFDYQVRKVNTKKGKMDVTGYKLSPREGSELIEVSKFGKPLDGVANGDTLLLRQVKVSIYNDEKKYLAQEVEILKKAEVDNG